jgi:hypothetical protein
MRLYFAAGDSEKLDYAAISERQDRVVLPVVVDYTKCSMG